MPLNDAERDAIDSALADWSQGDCVVGEQWFWHRFSPAQPLSEAAAEVASEGIETVETSELGLVVLSQTCELVRHWRERPFVEVAPLVQVGEQEHKEIERGYRPRYAFVPGVAGDRLVADLDRVMTIEKAVVADWTRVPGCDSEETAIRFSQALARKRARFAFPDDFSSLVAKLKDRLSEKHDRQSPEGDALRHLREIRVVATPSWNAESVDLMFLFIRTQDEQDFEGTGWGEWLAKWLEFVPPSGRYRAVEGIVVALEDLNANEYLASAQLDLDHVTSRAE